LDDLLDVLSKPPVNNKETVQRMVFCPASGEYALDWLCEKTPDGEVWNRSV
jgi:hypothetical protein